MVLKIAKNILAGDLIFFVGWKSLSNKSLGGFHLARQNLMEVTVSGLMRIG